MNKIPLLEKFAAQSLVYVDTGLSDGKELVFSKEKFAELIVRECISMADKESERYSNLDQEYCSMAMDNYRELVRKHFGVEE